MAGLSQTDKQIKEGIPASKIVAKKNAVAFARILGRILAGILADTCWDTCWMLAGALAGILVDTC